MVFKFFRKKKHTDRNIPPAPSAREPEFPSDLPSIRATEREEKLPPLPPLPKQESPFPELKPMPAKEFPPLPPLGPEVGIKEAVGSPPLERVETGKIREFRPVEQEPPGIYEGLSREPETIKPETVPLEKPEKIVKRKVIYIKLSSYTALSDYSGSMKLNLMEIGKSLMRMESSVSIENQKFESWQSVLENIQKDLVRVDKKIFSLR